MDRVLTTEERIKRAQEIYERRKSDNTRYNTARVNVNEKKNYKLLKKVFIQMLVCFIIYYAFYNINNNQYSFSENTVNKAKEILSYDINFNNLYNNIKAVFAQEVKEEQAKEIIPPEEVDNNTLEEVTLSATTLAEDISELEQPAVEEVAKKSQMELDADYIKQNIELVKPLEGVISSEFGQREATSQIVSEEHLGIDIAAEEGKKIVSAMNRQSNNSKKL